MFFFQREDNNRCDCVLDKKTNFIKDKEYLKIEGTGEDVLFVLEMYEPEGMLDSFLNRIRKVGIKNYTVISALRCQTKGMDIPSPSFKFFNKCDVVDKYLKTDKYPIIAPIGRALFSITKNSDITGVEDFYEYIFNDTFFLSGYEEDSYIRRKIYPLPPIYKTYKEKALYGVKDNFESFFLEHQLKKIKEEPKNFNRIQKYNIEKIDNPNEFLKMYFDKEIVVALDTETSGLDHYEDDFRVGCLTLSFDGVTGYYLNFDDVDLEILDKFLKNKHCVWANGSYDVKALLLHKSKIIIDKETGEKEYSLNKLNNLKIDDDIVNLLHVLDSNKKKNGLKTQSWFLGFGGYDDKLDDYINKTNTKNYLDIPESILMEYAVLDSIVTFRAWEKLMKLAEKQPEVFDNYRKRIIPVLPIYIEASIRGMKIDINHLNQSTLDLKEYLKELEEKVYSLLGNFNINSDEQLGVVLEKKGFSNQGRAKKGHYLTNEEILLTWKREGHEEIINSLLKYREVSKLISTFLGEVDLEEKENENYFFEEEKVEKIKSYGMAKHIKKDGGCHSEFMVALTGSGRIKGKNPNLLNLPKHGEEAKVVRKIFRPRNGYIFGEADFSGFQLRILAEYSQDATMKKIFNELSGDMHSVTANNIFLRNMTLDEVLKLKKTDPIVKHARTKSKAIAFALVFGAQASTLKTNALDNEWSQKEIDEYIENHNLNIIVNKWGKEEKYLTVAADLRKKFFNTYKNLLPTIEEAHNIGEKDGYSDSPFGGRRHLPMMTYKGEDYDRKEWANLQNISINSKTQNFEAMYMFESQIKIYNYLKENNLKTRIVNSVYDSILFEFYKEEVEFLIPEIFKFMEDYDNYSIPITIEQDLGGYWGFPDVDVDVKSIGVINNYIRKGFVL